MFLTIFSALSFYYTSLLILMRLLSHMRCCGCGPKQCFTPCYCFPPTSHPSNPPPLSPLLLTTNPHSRPPKGAPSGLGRLFAKDEEWRSAGNQTLQFKPKKEHGRKASLSNQGAAVPTAHSASSQPQASAAPVAAAAATGPPGISFACMGSVVK